MLLAHLLVQSLIQCCTKRSRTKTEEKCFRNEVLPWNHQHNVWVPVSLAAPLKRPLLPWQLISKHESQRAAVLPENSRGAVLLFPVASSASLSDWVARAVCISFRMLQEIWHEIVWDWTSLYFNCHHFESQPCRAAIARTVGWVVCTCVKWLACMAFLILFKAPIHLQINI